mgnify:CR=1 FL=1|jgi:chorismate mutase
MEIKTIVEQVGRFKVIHNIPVRTQEEEEQHKQEIAEKIYKMVSNVLK